MFGAVSSGHNGLGVVTLAQGLSVEIGDDIADMSLPSGLEGIDLLSRVRECCGNGAKDHPKGGKPHV